MGKIEAFKLIGTIECKGLWSNSYKNIADKEWCDNAVAGTLNNIDGTTKLELNGSLHYNNFEQMDESLEIFGYLSNGLYVKLEGCYQTNISIAAPGYITENFIATRCFVINSCSSNFTFENKIEATQMRFSLNYLEDWFNIDTPTFEDAGKDGEFYIKYTNEYFENNNYYILDGDFCIKLVRKQMAVFNIHRGSTPKVDLHIKICTKEYKSVSLETLLKHSLWVSDFINFITHHFGYLINVNYLLEDEQNRYSLQEELDGDFITFTPHYVGALLFPQLTYNRDEPIFNSLRLKDIYKDFGKLISNWFDNKSKLEYIISLYKQNQLINLDITTKLVNQIIIIETYYNNYMCNKREELNERDKKLDYTKRKLKNELDRITVENTIKEEIIKKLDSKLKNKHPTLLEKIKVVFENLPPEIQNIYKDIDIEWYKNDEFIDNFAARLRDTRNFYTHGANKDRNKQRYTSIKEMISVSNILEYIIYYLVIKTLGVDDDKILNYPFINIKLKALYTE